MKICGLQTHVSRCSHGCPSKCQSMGDRTWNSCCTRAHNCLSKGWGHQKQQQLVVLFVAQLEQLSDNFMNYSKYRQEYPHCCSRLSVASSTSSACSSCSHLVLRSALEVLLALLLSPKASLLRLVICQRFVDSRRTWGWPNLVDTGTRDPPVPAWNLARPQHTTRRRPCQLCCCFSLSSKGKR